ncbi:MAG TPA: SDR family oxidoreductase [Hypericibacter adhaerens]|uniref:SDR family oxidoreductase n=1 Tax=Hypericibacter adhaerens TaxID=2602016 RepID=UPI002B57F5DB|nr:SDR family oxidoreductase [Hypericibacter adhaerens]HWA45671.1 SDR family oxidoreductase [Hypericibacter adhaerens]
MRVLVLGAYGLIGTYVSLRLVADGHEVAGLGRRTAQAARRLPGLRWIAGDLRAMTRVESWVEPLRGIDAVINCAGVLQDGPNDKVAAVQTDAALALFRACEESGVRRVVHFSAPPSGSGTPFETTKRQADRALADSSLDWLILRPALVLAPQAYGGTALLRGLAALPFWRPRIAGAGLLHVVSVFDLAETVSRAIATPALTRRAYDLAHPASISLDDLTRAFRGWLGLAPVASRRLPGWLTAAVGRLADLAGWLGWRSPARTTALGELRQGIAVKPEPWIADILSHPVSLEQFLIAHPATVQERRFAAGYFLKPLGLVALAFFWVATGVLGLTAARGEAVEALLRGGLPDGLAPAAVVAGSVIDIALGCALLVARTARPALIGMILVSAIYLVVATVLMPGLWLDPFGALLKIVPSIVAALAMLALLPDR